MAAEYAKRMLVLSVGYGQGHHAAGIALVEHYVASGWNARMVDVCADACPGLFYLTQAFYRVCVRKVPWLWGVTYSLADTADWACLVRNPVFRPVLRRLQMLLQEFKPDLIVCTYPLFAYMLEALGNSSPYVMLVTDAREISRPWMRSKAPLVIVPDEVSARVMRERYDYDELVLVPAGFPVGKSFTPSVERNAPTDESLRILYGAYRRYGGVVADVEAMLCEFPHAKLTVLAGQYAKRLRRVFEPFCRQGRLTIIQETDQMSDLLGTCHLYIGKAGAATMFECYASNVPAIVNYTLPGQEQGNLELLLQDGAGYHAESTTHLMQILRSLISDGAAGWRALCDSMQRSGRSGAVERIAQTIDRRFGW